MSTIRRPSDAVSSGLAPRLTAISQLELDEIAATNEPEYRHVDYNRHPLNVHGLDHYIERFETNERFRVW
ncbi:hypothetical protein [Dyella sp. C11]|uniref:hypothetical protein n=1 Tax=Dyella sp. C11 TaxID=2126991 RepID=UPI000D65D5CF|nr:hypothetical protein [Dyella sp. C11]